MATRTSLIKSNRPAKTHPYRLTMHLTQNEKEWVKSLQNKGISIHQLISLMLEEAFIESQQDTQIYKSMAVGCDDNVTVVER